MSNKLKEEIEKLEKSKGYLEADIRLSQTNKILSIVKKIIDDFFDNCPGNYYPNKVFTPGEYHYKIVDIKKIQELKNQLQEIN